MTLNDEKLTEVLAFVTYVSAARMDATREQAAELREKVLPVLDNYRNGLVAENAVLAVVDAVMGLDWRPSGEWADQLTLLGFTREDTGKE
jgi:hypothetical protein